jgi:hypothetical protein
MSTATPKPYNTVYDGPTQQIQSVDPNNGWVAINNVLNSYTTTQKNALTPLVATIILDTTLNKLCFYGTDLAWHTVTSA